MGTARDRFSLLKAIFMLLSLVRHSCTSSSDLIGPNSPPSISHSIRATCNTISNSISSESHVYYPGSPQYLNDNEHFANSSSQRSTCSVEPGSREDVAEILKILGHSRTPFGVKSGGHIFNPNFSSTSGVQISLVRFNQINLHFDDAVPSTPSSYTGNSAVGTVTIGTGLVWDDVYAILDSYNLTVVGGRESGIGIGGYILSGGYSYKSNEYGLGLNNVVSFEIVLPNGTIANASTIENEDIFWAVRGSHNNFGIVTLLTLKTYSQSLAWGGFINYHIPSASAPITQALIQATYKYANEVNDPKAASVFAWSFSGGNATLSTHLFYSAPTPPSGIFDDFLTIPSLVSDISTRPYLSLVRSINDNAAVGSYTDVISVQKFSPNLIEAVINETFFWGQLAMQIDPKSIVSYPMEPFLRTIFSHENEASWPPPTSQPFFPQSSGYSWTSPSTDSWFLDAMHSSHKQLAAVLVQEGQNPSLPLYPNYAVFTATPEDIWGDNLGRLIEIKKRVDAEDVMGLTGGWKVPLNP